jgi:serine/threonine protein phosphatase PrpC
LLGGNQSTFIAIAALEEQYVGTCVGDSRVYLRDRDGQIHIITEDAVKYPLGSGNVEPFPIYIPSNRGDLVLLMSDGAWTPLNISHLKKVVNKSLFGHLSELPPAILDEAGKNGRADDMTVIAIKKTR